MSQGEPNYSTDYVNQVCGTCNGTGRTPNIVAAAVKVDDFTAQQAVHLVECTACGGAGWKTYGHR